MFDVSEQNFWIEIEEAEIQRDDVLTNYEMLLEQYVGLGTSIDPAQSQWPENHAFGYLSYMVAKIVIDNPRFSVTSRRQVATSMLNMLKQQLQMAVQTGQMDPIQAEKTFRVATQPNQISQAIQHGLNKWARDSDYWIVLDRLCTDFLTAFGVSLTTLGAMPGHDPRDPDSLRWPLTKRIAPTRFVQDSLSLHPTESRWMAHQSIEDKDNLIRRAKANPESGWIMSNLKALPEVTGREVLEHGTTAPIHRQNINLNRKEIVLYECWVPEYTEPGWPGPDEGFHGGLFTLAGTTSSNYGIDDDAKGAGQGTYIRKPQPFFGPKWGPYTQWGCYVNPTNAYPLSPLLVTFTQQAELNAHARAMSINAAQYKRLVIVSDRNAQLAEDLKSEPDMFVITTDDEQFDKNQVVVVEIAGISDQQLKHYQLFKSRLEELSGLTQTQRGNIEAGATATVESIAESSSDLRTSYVKNKFRAGVRQDAKSKAFYFLRDDRIQFELGPEAGEALQMLRPIFKGGPGEEGKDLTIEDLELEIDAYSMERTHEALLQRRIMEAFQMIIGIAPTMIQMPWIGWKKMVNKIGDALNLPDLGDMIDFDMIQQFSQMAMQGGQGPGQQMSGDGAMRQSRDSNQPNMDQARQQGQMQAQARLA